MFALHTARHTAHRDSSRVGAVLKRAHDLHAGSLQTHIGAVVLFVAAAVALLVLTAGSLSAQGGMNAEERERRLQEQLSQPTPIAHHNTVWIERMTWMEVRDALAAGKTTAIISTGGIEQNGPFVQLDKHQVVLEAMCDAIARELGDALCAPIVDLVPEGGIEEPTGHMRYPGTISMRPSTYEAILEDMASSLRTHGFSDIVFIGDSGGNQAGMERVANLLNERWDNARAHFVPEFYNYDDVLEYMETELGVVQPVDDGVHDNFYINSIMMTVDPTVVRLDERLAAGNAMINGVPLTPLYKTLQVGNALIEFRTKVTVDAIRAAIASN